MAVDRATYDREYQRSWRKANPERASAIQRRYRDSFPPGVYNLVRNHKLSVADATAVMANKPEHCEICGAEAKLYYDHDHASGNHRGWLCNACNVALNRWERLDWREKVEAYLLHYVERLVCDQ